MKFSVPCAAVETHGVRLSDVPAAALAAAALTRHSDRSARGTSARSGGTSSNEARKTIIAATTTGLVEKWEIPRYARNDGEMVNDEHKI
ncbi:MAG: hypothetical protein LBB79_04395 [Prevotellaceae bacterium]|nr:hypothetical protein [Prevotellaceae bacterium]